MKRSEVTYGQLDRVLRSLGFTCLVVMKRGEAHRYEHKQSGAIILLHAFPETDLVFAYHLVAVQTTLDLFGIADPTEFAAKLKKAG